jgi:RNA polymerase sigma-70 factor (ECF subfamily)
MPNLSPGSLFTLAELVGISPEAASSPLEQEVVRLYDESRHSLLRYVISLGIVPQDGEEIVQEVFFNLFRHLQQGSSRENLRAWIFRVARNLALRRHRSKRRKPEELFGLVLAPAVEPIDPLPNPEENAIWAHRQMRLLAALGSLPEQEQQCLHLRAEGLGYREIAEVLGIPLVTFARLIGRSLKKLRRVYED